jgi:hypothetical protein
MFLGGLFLFMFIVVTVPISYVLLSHHATCFDGIQNGGETAVDEGGPCLKLDPAKLSPASVLWARSFVLRDTDQGAQYSAVAYIVNPNPGAGVAAAHYHFGLYDSDNVLVAERDGTTFIMPQGTTPVIETGIDTGHRVAVHTYFTLTDPVLDWERMTSPAASISISNRQVDTSGMPRISAVAQNTSFSPLPNPRFIAVVFDPEGNAIAASATALSGLAPSASQQITFTWPAAFPATPGRVDITALLPPLFSQR